MTHAIVAHLPVAAAQTLTACQTSLADRKVAGLVFSLIEESKHSTMMLDPNYKSFYEAKAARVHPINDSLTKVYDATQTGVVSVVKVNGVDRLFLRGSQVQAVDDHSIAPLLFSRAARVDFVVVTDGPKTGHFSVCQQDLPKKLFEEGQVQQWMVNTRLGAHVYLAPPSTITVNTPDAAYCTYFARTQPEGDKVVSLTEKDIAAMPAKLGFPLMQKRIDKVLSDEVLSEEEKALHNQALQKPQYLELFQAKAARIYTFEDATVKLLDYTEKAIASIIYDVVEETEYIGLKGLKVLYPQIVLNNPKVSYSPFTRGFPCFSDRVIISDVPNQNWVKIERQYFASCGRPNTVTHYVHLNATGIVQIPADPETQYPGARLYKVENTAPNPVERPHRVRFKLK